jgi:hypothetical protein
VKNVTCRCWRIENGDFVVLHSLAADIDSDLPRGYPGSFQQESLAVENVLV